MSDRFEPDPTISMIGPPVVRLPVNNGLGYALMESITYRRVGEGQPVPADDA